MLIGLYWIVARTCMLCRPTRNWHCRRQQKVNLTHRLITCLAQVEYGVECRSNLRSGSAPRELTPLLDKGEHGSAYLLGAIFDIHKCSCSPYKINGRNHFRLNKRPDQLHPSPLVSKHGGGVFQRFSNLKCCGESRPRARHQTDANSLQLWAG